MSPTMIQAILWLMAGIVLVMFLARRRRRRNAAR